MTKMPSLIATTAPFSVKLTTTHVDPWRSNTYARLFSLSPTTRWSPSMATAEPNASVECAGDCTGACSVDSSVQVEVASPGTTRTYTFTAPRSSPSGMPTTMVSPLTATAAPAPSPTASESEKTFSTTAKLV